MLAFIFYFDLINTRKMLEQGTINISDILNFQHEARQAYIRGSKGSACVTLSDNVLVRQTLANDQEFDQRLYEVGAYSLEVAKIAVNNGFKDFFGVITYGEIDYKSDMDYIITADNDGDVSSQHIWFLSEPYMRSALCEKYSRDLANINTHPCPNTIWVSEEAREHKALDCILHDQGLTFDTLGEFDLYDYKFLNLYKAFKGKSKFEPICPK